MNIGMNAGVVGHTPGILKFTDNVNSTEKGVAGLTVNVHILFFRGNVGNDEHFGETGLPIEIAAREEQRIAVQVVKHIAML